MNFCTCPNRPNCGWKWCEQKARWSVLRSKQVTFMCEGHHQTYLGSMTKRIPGIDPPAEMNPEDWKGSLVDMVKMANISRDFAQRGRS